MTRATLCAPVVFVHGIGSHREATSMCAEWTESLTDGMVLAGHGRLARNVRLGGDTRMAYYRDLFLGQNRQGSTGNQMDELEAALLATVLRSLVDQMLAQASDTTEQVLLARAQSQLKSIGEVQGIGNIARRCINAATTLMQVRPWRQAGAWATSRAMLGDLRQVTRYLCRGEPDINGRTLDQRIRDRVLEALTPDAVVLAHSLGSVVAIEALQEYMSPVRLFVTFGSPLGMRTVILPHLRPQPPTTPDSTRFWLNLWDKDDILAGRPYLKEDFRPNRSGVQPTSQRVDSDGMWVHPANYYLSQPGLAGPVAEAMKIDPL